MASLTLTWDDAAPRPALGAAPWLAAASFATVTQALMVPGLLPGLADGLSASVAEAGQATSVFALAAALGALPIARLGGRWSGRAVVLAGLGGLSALNFLAGLAPSLALLLVLRFVAGLLAAAVLPAAPALAAELAGPAGRVRALATVTFGATLAFALGLPAATLLGAAFGWRAAFMLAGVLCGAAALVLAWRLPSGGGGPLPVLPPLRGKGDRSRRVPYRSLSRGAGEGQGGGSATRLRALLAPPIPATLLLVLLAFASVFASQAFLGPIANATLKTSPALLQAMMAAGALAGVPAGAVLAERAANAPAAIAGALLAAALWQWGLLAGDLHSPLLQAGQTFFASAALFAVSPVLQARLVAAAGESRRLVLAANFVAVSLGQAAGTLLGGVGLDAAGLPGAAALGVLAAALMLARAGIPFRG